MAVKITYFVHGTTTDNEKEISSGWSDVGLSELGIKQSTELKDKIKDKKFEVVFCSDLKRAADSARLIFEGVAPVSQDTGFRHLYHNGLLIFLSFGLVTWVYLCVVLIFW